MFEARVKQVANLLEMPNINVRGFNTSTFNHFTGKHDVFLGLQYRKLVYDKSTVSADYLENVIDLEQTFAVIEDSKGNKYLVQRDLYAASKMLFLYPVKEKRINTKTGKEYEVTLHKLNQEEYSKWFEEVFYPKHIEYLKYLIKLHNLGVKLNGTILGM